MKKPSREYDAEIAEKVMGWKRVVRENAHYDFEREAWIDASGIRGPLVSRWCPSTDLTDAFIVAEHLKLFLDRQTDLTDGYSDYVQLWQTSDGMWVIGDWEDQLFILAKASTVPLVICEAALKVTPGVKR